MAMLSLTRKSWCSRSGNQLLNKAMKTAKSNPVQGCSLQFSALRNKILTNLLGYEPALFPVEKLPLFMSYHILECTQKLPISLEEAWEFFSEPTNLKTITPEYMGFEVISDSGSKK